MDLFVCGNRFPQWFDFFSVSYSASVSIIVLKGDELRLFLTKKEEAPTSDSLFLFLPPSSSFFLLPFPSLLDSSRKGGKDHTTLCCRKEERELFRKSRKEFFDLSFGRGGRDSATQREIISRLLSWRIFLCFLSPRRRKKKRTGMKGTFSVNV
mmetsp:Transcript_40803/g.105860  ORF Transcript_40803/g.105860 Transcript_40803/m.105860 type:complete len:153 (-) Transcript_40803:2493-2951(-)